MFTFKRINMESPFVNFSDEQTESYYNTIPAPSNELFEQGPFVNESRYAGDSEDELYHGQEYNFYESAEEERQDISQSFFVNNQWEDIDKEEQEDFFSGFTVEPQKGITDYLAVSAVRGLSLKTGIFIPPSFSKPASVNIVVYLHGIYGNGDRATGLESYWNDYSDIRKYFYEAGKDAILIAPGLSSNPQNDSVLLNHSGGLDNFLNACLAALKSKNYVSPGSQFGQIILAAHSAGGKPLSIILKSVSQYLANVVECWGFDCIYADSWGQPMSNWAKGNKKFYHYWAWSCSASYLDKCPKVIADRFQKTNPSNFINIAPSPKTGHQQVIEDAWLNKINARNWFDAGISIPVPVVVPSPAYAATSSPDTTAAYAKMNLQSLGLSFDAFRIACNGYRKLVQNGQLKNTRVLSIADFTQSSRNKRLYILDMQNQEVILQIKVAHGKRSVKKGDPREKATIFSNVKGSNASSLGFYITLKTYTRTSARQKQLYPGEADRQALRIGGVEKDFNSNAKDRSVVIHGSKYVHNDDNSDTGLSWGCPMVDMKYLGKVISNLKEGSCFFIYFNDPLYLSKSLLAKDPPAITQEDFFSNDFENELLPEGDESLSPDEHEEMIYETEGYENESEGFNYVESETDPPADTPSGRPVPFAPLPPSGSYWPLQTKVREGRLVSYVTQDGKTIGNSGRKFLADRTTDNGDPRNHVGIDLYADFNDPVIACDNGTILSFKHFYTTKTGKETYSLVVQHSNVIINYGEVGKSSFPRLNLHVGDTVRAGQVIGFVGPTQMLHFEVYRITGNTSNLPPHRWMDDGSNPPPDLYNPTKYLLYLKDNGLQSTATAIVSQPATTTAAASSSQWANAIRLNNFYKSSLGWNQYYEQINDMLLPYSGLSNVDLDEASLAQAVAAWQHQQGLSAKNSDGVIGPDTWTLMKQSLNLSAQSSTQPSSTTNSQQWANAIRLNNFYKNNLGWEQYYEQINNLVLPFSGLSNVDLDEAGLAQAIAGWQRQQGFSAKNADGVIGPGTWSVMSRALNIGGQTSSSSSVPATGTEPTTDQKINGVRFARKTKGWAAYGGGDLKARLQSLSQRGLLSVSQNEIEMYALVSIPESGGLVNAINSWDSASMSMGFFQFTVQYGELQKVIRLAPAGFRKFGIELDYSGPAYPDAPTATAILHAPHISDLRKLDWATRFYNAGLEDDVIVAQVAVARNTLADVRRRFDAGNYLDKFDYAYPNLWAFIYEANNSRPSILHSALKNAIAKAISLNISDAVQFGRILIVELNTATIAYYSNKKYPGDAKKDETIKAELDKVERIISRVGVPK